MVREKNDRVVSASNATTAGQTAKSLENSSPERNHSEWRTHGATGKLHRRRKLGFIAAEETSLQRTGDHRAQQGGLGSRTGCRKAVKTTLLLSDQWEPWPVGTRRILHNTLFLERPAPHSQQFVRELEWHPVQDRWQEQMQVGGVAVSFQRSPEFKLQQQNCLRFTSLAASLSGMRERQSRDRDNWQQPGGNSAEATQTPFQ